MLIGDPNSLYTISWYLLQCIDFKCRINTTKRDRTRFSVKTQGETDKTMARPRTHHFWIDKIRSFVVNRPGSRATTIYRMLTQQMANGGLNVRAEVPATVPDERTIRRTIREFAPLAEAARVAYRWFHWPDSMNEGYLPWEASRACLDLMRLRIDNRMEPPTIE